MKSSIEAMFEARANILKMEAEIKLLEAKTGVNKQWVGLSIEDKNQFLAQDLGGSRLDAMDWTEKRLKEKNNG